MEYCGLSVGLSVMIVSPAKMAEAVKMPFRVCADSGWPKEPCIRLGPDPSM